MQAGQHDFGGAHAFFFVDAGRDAAAVVAHGHAAVAVERQFAPGRVAGLRLVDRVVDNFEGHMVQAGAVIGVTDVHAGALADRFQPTQDGDG